MAFRQSATAKRERNFPTPYARNGVTALDFTFTFSETFAFGGTDKLELGVLPAFSRVVDYQVIPENMAGAVVNIGLMSGTFGVADSARTVGTELFAAQSVTDTAVAGTSKVGQLIAPTGADRSIGLTVNTADITAGATKKVTLRLLVAAGEY